MILITGGLGFIGLHTARSLLDIGEEVVLTQYRVAREPAFIREELGRRAFVEQLDVTDADALMSIGGRYKITGILHLATPGLGALGPADEYKVNMYGLLNVLAAGGAWEVKRIGLASSVAVYTGVQDGPFSEEMPLRLTPSYPVEAYKKASELLASHYAQRTSVDVVMLRIAGIWGPLYHSMGNAVSRMVHGAVRGRAPELRGDTYEDDASDMCYVRDCGRGVALLQTASSLSHSVYNIGAGRATSNREFADAIRRRYPEAVLPLKPGASASRNRPFMDLTRIKQDVGYVPEYSLEAAMDDYIAWLQENAE
jgi:UDP-glucose 4-epimerase